jgi:predicted permease
VALRISLGAARGRLVRQALTESLLLAGAGALLGILFAVWGGRVILRFLPDSAGEPFTAAPDGPVLAFTLALSFVSALLFGLAPAFRSTAVDPAAALGGGRGSDARQPALRKALVAAQVAFSVVLVVLAGLFGHSLSALRSIDPGFRNQNVIAFTLTFPESWTSADTKAARRRFLDRLETMPGVSLVSFGFPGPFLGGTSSSTVRVPGAAIPKEAAWIGLQVIGPRYFEAIGSLPSAGREFDRTDIAGARRVVVVNEAFVREYLPAGARVLDRPIETGMNEGPVFIVGVVRDILHAGLRRKPEPTVYVPAAQNLSNWEPTILVRSDLPPDALVTGIRRELAGLDPQIAASAPKTIRQRIDDSIFRERLLATMGGFFGFLALTLAAIGLYGVVSYGTARRSREIGIRIAMGARRGGVLWMVLRDALLLVVLGLAAGLPFSIIAAKKVTTVLFGIQPADAATFAVTAGVLLAIGIAAALVPARRAAAMDPMRVLRIE